MHLHPNLSRTLGRFVASAVTVPILLALAAAPAGAVPAFARKYATSCQTCHIAYPKLNNFGVAFRLLGYHMPGETEAQVKQPDVPLGAPAYKRVWPDAVWPGAIPSHVPISLVAQFLVQNSSQVEEGARTKVENDFIFPSEVALVAGGTAGDNISYFAEVVFEQEVEDGVLENNTEIEHMDMRFIRPIKNSPAFNVKIGAFQPELVEGFDHARRLTIANYDSMFGVAPINLEGAESVGGGHHGGGGGIALPAIATGFELYGVARSRLLWAVGLVNGQGPGNASFDGNSTKDVYARAAYKWGGLAPDGSNAETYAGSEKNWRERSFRVGVFTYQGDGSGIFLPVADEHGGGAEPHDAASAAYLAATTQADDELEVPAFLEDRSFDRVGIDFNWFYKDLNVFGGYVKGEDDLRAFAAAMHDAAEPGDFIDHESGTFTYRSWFVEADAVLHFPWLHGALRYESVDLPNPEVDSFDRATVSFVGLVRANAKVTFEYTWDLNESQNHSAWLGFGLAF